MFGKKGKEFLHPIPIRSTFLVPHVPPYFQKHRFPFLLSRSQGSLLSQNLSRQLSAALPSPRWTMSALLPSNCSSLPLFFYSGETNISGWRMDDLVPCIQYRSWQKRGRVLYSRWKERILSSVGYRSGFRLGGENEANDGRRKRGWSLTMAILPSSPTREETWTFGRSFHCAVQRGRKC